VEQIVLPVIDTDCVARAVLGRHWRAATPEQRTRFTEELQTLLIRTYAAPLVTYTDVEITYPPPLASEAKDHVTVRTLIQYGTKEPVPVHYWLRHRNGEWKACDVTIAGVSAAVTFRSTFNHEIQKTGLEGFLDRLIRHNRERDLRPPDDTGDTEIPLPEFGSQR
jgi:phospholipid transport system substrate-binding protein